MKNETERLIPESMYASAICRGAANYIDRFILTLIVFAIAAITISLYNLIPRFNLVKIFITSFYESYSAFNLELIFNEIMQEDADEPTFIHTFIPIIVIYILYFVVLQSSRQRATYGMRLLAIQVVGENLNKISQARALGRLVMFTLFSFIPGYFLIALFMIAFSKKKQAPHDILSGTYVIYKYAQSPNGKVQLLDTLKAPDRSK